MPKWRNLILIGLSWILFATAHAIFTRLFLYWTFWWLDIVMHTWGAALVISTWFLIERAAIFPRAFKSTFLHPILCLSYLIVGWEIFEYLIGKVAIDRGHYVLDTTIDVLVGISSGIITFWLLKSRTMNK